MKQLVKVFICLVILLSIIGLIVYLILNNKSNKRENVESDLKLSNITYKTVDQDGFKTADIIMVPTQPSCKNLHDCMPVLNDLMMNHVTPTYCDSPHNEIVYCNQSVAIVNRISQRKCLEYIQYTFEEIERETDDPASSAIEIDYLKRCYIDYTGFSIIGGSDTKRYEFSHMVAVGAIHPYEKDYIWLCGGSIISERFVLSAAHCKITLNGTQEIEAKYVKIGAWNFSKKNEKGTRIIEIEDFILYPKYKKELVYHDIGLIRLRESISFSFRIRPICLPYSEALNKKEYVATGWGKEKTSLYEGPLQKVDLNVKSDEVCRQFFHSDLTRLNQGLADHQICLGEGIQNDTCKGASGGPIHGIHDDIYCSYVIVAITSTGFKCDRGKPGLYTKVHNYLDWIETTVWG